MLRLFLLIFLLGLVFHQVFLGSWIIWIFVTLALPPPPRWRLSPGVGGVEEEGPQEADRHTRPQADPPTRPQDLRIPQDRLPPLRLPG